jgi:hypothetical protein
VNRIKGLLLKDLLIFKNYKKNIIISTIVYISIIFMASTEYNMLFYGTSFFLFVYGINSISTFSYDEVDSTDKYILSLTLNRKEVVLSKYIFAFLNALIVTVFGFLISVLSSFLTLGKLVDFEECMRNIILMFTGVSFLICADIPCIYKWGVEKGRMQAVIVPVVLILLAGLIGTILILIFPFLATKIVIKTIMIFSNLICFFGNILFYYISYKVSLKIFSKKDL